MSVLAIARFSGLLHILFLAAFLVISPHAWADMSMYNGDAPQPTPEQLKQGFNPQGSAINGPAAPATGSPLGNNSQNPHPDEHDHWNHDFDPNQAGPTRDVNPYAAPIFVAPFPPNCGPTTVIVCHTPVPVPYTGTIGSSYTVAMPYPYTNRTFSVQCVNMAGAISYQVVNPGSVSCAYPICADSTVNVCGSQVPVPGGTHLDDKIDVPLPSSVVGAVAASSGSITAVCLESADGTPVYQLGDASQVSCNVFPCTDSEVRLCGTSIPVKGGAQLGEVVHMTMPAPFAKDPFDVSCLGTLGAQAIYQVSNSSEVTCNTDPTRPAP